MLIMLQVLKGEGGEGRREERGERREERGEGRGPERLKDGRLTF